MKPLSLFLGLTLLSACGSGERFSGSAGVEHLFPANGLETLDLSRLGELTKVPVLSSESFVRQGTAPLEAATSRAEAVFRVNAALESRSFDLLEIDVEGLPAPAGASIVWSADGSLPPGESKVVALVPSHTGGERQTLRFDLAAEPGWRGRLGDLQLRLAGASPGFRLVAVRTWKRVLSPDELAGMRNRTFRVELGHEVREAMLLPPGEPWRSEIRTGPGSRVRIALGATAGAATPIEVHFRLVPRDASGPASTEIRRSFGVVPGEIGNWLEWQFSAARFEGELIVDWKAEGATVDGARGLVFLASPAVISPRLEGRPNVLVVSLDTLRADHLSLYGYSRTTSPELDAWAGKHAVVFENVVAAAGSTLPSHTSMLTGLDVLHHGAIGAAPAREALETLAERFRAGGYTTRAWTGGAFLDPRFGLSQGFEVFRFWPRGAVEASQEIEDGFGRARKWLREEREEPFFLFLHTYEIHGPYRAREPWWSNYRGGNAESGEWAGARIWPRSRAAEAADEAPAAPGEDPFRGSGRPAVQFGRIERPLEAAELPGVRDFYDSGIAKADVELGRLFGDLQDLDLAGRTIVVVTADHGESLGEHGLWSHGYLFEDNLRVPLVLAAPGLSRTPARVSATVGLVDLAPTLLDLAGLPALSDIDGRSLATWMAPGQPAGPERTYLSYAWDTQQGLAVRRGWAKLLMRDALLAPPESQELYDLSVDPGERQNLAGTPIAGERLEELRREAWRRLVAPRQSGVTLQVANRGTGGLRMALRIPGLAPAGLRVAAPACRSCVGLTSAGDLELILPAGQFVRFWAPVDKPRVPLELEVLPGGPLFRRDLDRQNLCGKPLDVTPENSSGFIVTASAEGSCAAPEGAAGALEDAALRARLEALGYL